MQRTRRFPASVVAAVLLVTFIAAPVAAQEREVGDSTPNLLRQVALDPTTYLPAVLSYKAMRLDWDSSQVFFANGYLERNPRYTRTGLPNGMPVSYGVGTDRIRSSAFRTLQVSVINNVANRVTERLLERAMPNHPKVVKTLGWVERIGFSSYLSYVRSAPHFRQWKQNEQMARQMGMR
jgi:hypothetical protein